MHLYKKERKGYGVKIIFSLLFLCTVLILIIGSRKVEETAQTQQISLLKDALNQAIVNCYAVEGRYPESLDYIIENYGIQINTEKFIVTYDIFAENVRPQLNVIQIGE